MNRMTSCHIPGIGSIWVARTKRGICGVALKGGKRTLLDILPTGIEWKTDATIGKPVVDYMMGKRARPTFDILTGTPFQKKVWRAIATIPRGETRSYTWLAKKIGKPKAVRAVANACGANPIPILIPCHCVIASDGSIGGFSSGVAIKRTLLSLETVEIL